MNNILEHYKKEKNVSDVALNKSCGGWEYSYNELENGDNARHQQLQWSKAITNMFELKMSRKCYRLLQEICLHNAVWVVIFP